ncbi:helicase DnaB [Ensifer adhaerens]|uniref:replicative DNA helicase n=1 Tax=Ensifer canadensis TaxID=555315 RepID=UPI001490185F|nr:DnaB-like helicase C-terminal domain-containing protein [Ensifer canadensis]NOV17868.1 helicase DnaB [Ensifer canadensis]
MNMMHGDLRRELTPAEKAAHSGDQREIPESLVEEQLLLGAILINNTVLDAIKVPIEADHFFEPLHRKMFNGMMELKAEGKIIDPVSISSHVPKNEKVGDKTVFQYIAALAANACSIVMAPQHAETIFKAWVARESIVTSREIEAMAYDHWAEMSFMDKVSDLANRFRARVDELHVRERQRPGDAYMDSFSAAAANSGAIGVSIGLKELRKVLNESVFEAGNLYGLLSSSGEGKTSLTVQIILHALKEGHPVIFLSYDESASQIVRRMIALEHGIDAKQQKDPNGSMSQWERDQSVLFANWLNSQPFEVIRCRREGVARLIAYARQFISRNKTGKTPLVVIDHILKIKPRDDRMSPDKISGDITVELKSFADETQSAVLLLNQRNGEGIKRDNPRPIGRDIYGGEGAKQDYDAIAYLYRPAKYHKDMIATAADDKTRAKVAGIFSEFGDKLGKVAEIGAIKVRFGDPDVKMWLEFQARYTRYASMEPPVAQERMI